MREKFFKTIEIKKTSMLYEYKGSELGKCLHTDIKTCTHDTHMLDICDTDSINSLRRERRQEERRHETPTTPRESQSDPPTSDYPALD